jgi:type I restriction enzyme S subunit
LASKAVKHYLINYHIIRVALDQSRCSPVFIEAAFQGEIVKTQIAREKGRGTREGINTAQLKALEFPLAPLQEQRLIASVLRSQVSLIDEANRNVEKLRMLKNGLMRDLLTGCVRVDIEESTA